MNTQFRSFRGFELQREKFSKLSSPHPSNLKYRLDCWVGGSQNQGSKVHKVINLFSHRQHNSNVHPTKDNYCTTVNRFICNEVVDCVNKNLR